MRFIFPDIDKVAESQNRQYIYILLLRYPDVFSVLFRLFTRCKYNHVSIGVSGSNGIFYSYVTKGFRKEFPRRHPTFKQHEVPCKLYQVEVSNESYNSAKAVLEDHEKQANRFKYNFLGVILCLLRIVRPIKNRYFCSQFVSDILQKTEAIPLAKHCSLYLPDDFTKTEGLDLCFSGCLSQLVGQLCQYKMAEN